jgi:leishmanolysin
MISSSTKLFLIVLIGLYVFPAIAHESDNDYDNHDHHVHSHHCMHDQIQKEPEVFPVEDVDPESLTNGRQLADAWAPLRIYADYTYLTNVTPEQKSYIQRIVEATLKYWNAALKVKPLTSILIPKYRTSTCGLKFPPVYFTGTLQYDLALFVTAETSYAGYVAWAQACTILADTKRPIFGQINFNLLAFPSMNEAEYYRGVAIALHETTHALGFTSTLFPSWPSKPTVGQLNNFNGNFLFYLDAQPLTDIVRTHFNCPTCKGAYLEQEGGYGSAGSHFERRIFGTELMTGSEVKDMRASIFTLAALHSSGWYQADLSMAEPHEYGKGRGCAFLDETCVDMTTKQAKFPEFCSGLTTYGCTADRKFGAYCGTPSRPFTDPFLDPAFNYFGNNSIVDDFMSDNCPYMMPYSNLNCEDSSKTGLIAGESYGPGSRCFMGNLYPLGPLKKNYQYCLKSSCQKVDGQWVMKLIVGSASVSCTQAGPAIVDGYKGTILCPDPAEFCGKTVAPYCVRGCMGRGTCVDNTCQCNPGWGGLDCSLSTTTKLESQTAPSAPAFDPRDVQSAGKPQRIDGHPGVTVERPQNPEIDGDY